MRRNTLQDQPLNYTANYSASPRNTGAGQPGDSVKQSVSSASRFRAASGRCQCDVCTWTRYKTGEEPEDMMEKTG